MTVTYRYHSIDSIITFGALTFRKCNFRSKAIPPQSIDINFDSTVTMNHQRNTQGSWAIDFFVSTHPVDQKDILR